MPRVRGLGPRDNPCGVRNASKSDLDEDVEIGIIGGVDEGGCCSETVPDVVESFRDSLRRASGGAGLGEPRCRAPAAAETPIRDGGLGSAISEFEIRSRCIWFGFIFGGNAGCWSVLKSPKMS